MAAFELPVKGFSYTSKHFEKQKNVFLLAFGSYADESQALCTGRLIWSNIVTLRHRGHLCSNSHAHFFLLSLSLSLLHNHQCVVNDDSSLSIQSNFSKNRGCLVILKFSTRKIEPMRQAPQISNSRNVAEIRVFIIYWSLLSCVRDPEETNSTYARVLTLKKYLQRGFLMHPRCFL